MRAVIVLCFCCWLAIVIVAAASSTSNFQGKPTPNQVSIDYKLPASGISLHEPVILVFSVQNGLPQPITLTLGGQNRQFFQFWLTTPDGQVLKSSPPAGWDAEVVIFDGQGKALVAPGGIYQQPLLMNQWFHFTTPGTYLLTSRLTTNIDVSGDASLPPQNQITRLLVHPRDPVRLEKVCAELANQVEVSQSVEAAIFPALKLSYVEDPIAVPYLAQVMRSHTLAYDRAIPGLERIGNDDAIEVLLSALSDSYGGIADLATGTLARMQDRITNPRLKDAVKKAVQLSLARARNAFIKQQIAYLDYRDPHLQDSAIQNLTKVEDGLHQAEPVLQRLANDPHQPADVRAAARDALQKLHPPQ